MKEVNKALDIVKHVVSLRGCEDVVDEEKEELEFVDSDYEFSEDDEANKGCNVDINMPCDEELNVETETQGPGEISDDGADSDTLYSDGNTSDDENTSRHHLKEAIKEYAIVNSKLLKFDKNDKRRVKVMCCGSGNCAFVLYASKIDKEESTFVIKAIHAKHTCGRVDRLRYANSTWISERFCDKMRRNPNWIVGQLQDEVREHYTMNVTQNQVYRAKKLAKKVIQGFLEGCRPVVGGDGCHLKGPCSGQILTAVSVDGNNGLALKHLLWAAVRATTLPWWEAEMDNMKDDPDAWGWLIERPAKNWYIVGPRILNKIEKNKLASSQCIPRRWDLCGIPCPYAISTIFQRNEDREDYVDKLYKKKAYLKTYGLIIGHVPSIDQWPKSSLPAIKPPHFIFQPGRPRKIRCTRCSQEGHTEEDVKGSNSQAPAPQGQVKAPAPQRQAQAPAPQPQPQLVAATRGGRGRGRMRGLGRSSSQPQAQAQAPVQVKAQGQTEAFFANIQARAVAATRGGTSRGRMKVLGRSSSQPQPHALPPNIQGSAPI
ncbi:unnamed protein product [Prunus armeniaca]